MTEDQFDFDVRLIRTNKDTAVLTWPAELDERQRRHVLSKLITQLHQDGIWIQADDVSDPRQCLLRAEANTWTHAYMKVFAALSNALCTTLRTPEYTPSVMVGYVKSAS